MSTLFYLIRHGSTDHLGKSLSGRMPGVHLNAAGLREAEAVGQFLAPEGIEMIFASPLERTRETAGPLAARLGLPVTVAAELNEIDCGAWTNRSFADLQRDERWRRWNSFRSAAGCPEGEQM